MALLLPDLPPPKKKILRQNETANGVKACTHSTKFHIRIYAILVYNNHTSTAAECVNGVATSTRKTHTHNTGVPVLRGGWRGAPRGHGESFVRRGDRRGRRGAFVGRPNKYAKISDNGGNTSTHSGSSSGEHSVVVCGVFFSIVFASIFLSFANHPFFYVPTVLFFVVFCFVSKVVLIVSISLFLSPSP